MKKIIPYIGIFYIALYLVLPLVFSHASQQLMLGVLARKNASSCGDYSTCGAGCKLLDWDCSSADLTANVCSVGDTGAAQVGEIDITTNPGKVTIVDGSDDGNDRFCLSTTEYDLFPAGDVTIEITINLTVINTGSKILDFTLDGDNYFEVKFLCTSGNDLGVYHMGNGTSSYEYFDTNLNTSTEYVIIIKCGTANGMAMSTNGGGSYTTSAGDTITTMTHSGTGVNALTIGNDAAPNTEGTIDNVRVSYGWRTDI